MKQVQVDDWLNSIRKIGANKKYKAMYSTLWGGIVSDPALMLIPIDDHMVHRGDGVFEAIRFTDKKIYLLGPHLERLFRSAEAIFLNPPKTIGEIREICSVVQRVSGLSEGILRVFVGRGGGDFSANPYATTGAELHVVATAFAPVPLVKYAEGASVMFSSVPVKQGNYAQIKSLNYLPNVLMKKESVDKGFDFSIGLTLDEKIAEGPTENILLWTREGHLVAPNFSYTLRGTTLLRMMELAKNASSSWRGSDHEVHSFEVRDIFKEEIFSAREVMMIGTTLGVLPITKVENSSVGSGRVGPMSKTLGELFQQDLNG